MWDYDKLITKNFYSDILAAKRLRNIAVFGIPLGFICFGGGVPLIILTKILALIIVPIFGFACIPASIVLIITNSNKLIQMKSIENVINIVKSQDKIFIYQIQETKEAQTILMLNKLIDLRFLEEYEIIGGVMIAKRSLHIDDTQALREYSFIRFGKKPSELSIEGKYDDGTSSDDVLTDNLTSAYYGSDAKECYYCHEKLASDAVYCSKCGARQDY